ncbi:transcriptional regulator [Colwelliaceae bacterium 6441]
MHNLEEYLLNGRIKFCVSTSTLTSKNNATEKENVKLDHLESLVLNILVVNFNNIVSHEEFLSNWRSSEATVNSLFRVISKLRGKLKQAGLNEKVIFNTPKKGYSLVANVEFKSSKKAPKQSKNLAKNRSKYKVVFYIGAYFLILFVIFSMFYTSRKDETAGIEIGNISYFELLSNTDFKLELTSNLLNDYIAYTIKSKEKKFWQIEIFDRFSDKNIVIKDEYSNSRKPTWISENSLIYRAYNEEYCRIKLATIDYKYQTYTSNHLFSCNPESYSSSIAKLNSSQILFSEAKLGSKASNLYKGDIKTGLIQPLDAHIASEGGLGIYNVITSPKSELIVLLSSKDGVKDKIRLVDPNNNWKVIWTETLTKTNVSVGWDGTSLSYRNNNGGITIVNFKDHQEVNRIHLPFIASINNISSTNKGLIFTSGDFVAKNIVYTDFESLQSILLTESLFSKNILAHFYNESLVLYVSNKSGINQVILYDLNNNTSKQISSFKKNIKIANISSSVKHSKVALELGNEIKIFDLSPEFLLSEKSIKVGGIKPEFYDNKFVFTKISESQSSLHSFSLDTARYNDLGIQGGYIAKSNGKSLFYSKLYAPGIWQYQKEGKDKLILDLPSSAYKWHIDSNKIYYRNDLGEYSIFNISTGVTSDFISPACESIINVKGGKCLSSSNSPTSNRVILLNW